MLTQRPDQRVAVFIDTQNMYHTAKHIYNRKVSFSNLVEAAVGPRILVRAIAYVAKSKDNVESAFFEALQQQGIELKIKDVQEFASGAKKADWDVGMAVDAIALSPKVDVIVLATGDGDFVPLVEYLKGHGVICEVVAFKESTNARLREVADSFLDMSAEADEFLIGEGRPGTKRLPGRQASQASRPAGKTTSKTKGNDHPGTKDTPRNIRITY